MTADLFHHSPGDDDFEDHNMSDDLNMSRKVSHMNVDHLYRHTVDGITSNELSPGLKGVRNNSSLMMQEEVMMHKDAYEIVYKHYPPNPILPKNFQVYDGSPRSGGEFAFL